MRKHQFLITIALLLSLLGVGLNSNFMKNITPPPFEGYEKAWKKVAEFENQDLPKSALQVVNRIYEQARKDNKPDQRVKAVIHKMKYEMMIEDDGLLKSIHLLESETNAAIFPEKALLQSMLAEAYWNYYTNNSWKFYNRGNTEIANTNDISTWSLQQLKDKINVLYNTSLKEKELLKKIQLEVFDELITKGKDSRKFRPTFFDFISWRALNFYENSSESIIAPIQTFELKTTSALLPFDEFIYYPFQFEDSTDLKFQAILLYQEIIKLHLSTGNKKALADADLNRIQFAQSVTNNEDKAKASKQAYNRLLQATESDDFFTEVAYRYAQFGLSNYELIKSDFGNEPFAKKAILNYCSMCLNKFPKSDGAKNLESLMAIIKEKNLSAETEHIMPTNKPSRIKVTYKNIGTIFCQIKKLNYENFLNVSSRGENERLEYLKKQKNILETKYELPLTEDYSTHSCEVKIDPIIEPGFYVLLLSASEDFGMNASTIFCTIWLTNLAVTVKDEKYEKQILVVNNQLGKPIHNAAIETYYLDYNYQNKEYIRQKGTSITTNLNGFASLPKNINDSRSYFFKVSSGSDQYIPDYSLYLNRGNDPKETEVIQSHLFADRAIYRPGQTVYFKGIILKSNYEGRVNQLAIGYETEVQLNDANGQEVQKIKVRTNEFGSYSGQFNLPTNRMNGEFKMYDGYAGEMNIRVEEYKRPKFYVEFPPVTSSNKLNEEIEVEGKAITYAGAVVDAGKVTYRVVRTVQYNCWYGWYNYLPSAAQKEIANGTTSTDENGTFRIAFQAIPELNAEKRFNPTFCYKIIAEVTDINGETHSNEILINIGYQSIVTKLIVNQKIEKNEQLKVIADIRNLNGNPERAKGSLLIQKIKTSPIPLRARLWTEPDTFLYTENEFKMLFPEDEYRSLGPDEDVVEKTVFVKNFSRNDSLVFSFGSTDILDAGKYLITLKAFDKDGKEVKNTAYFELYPKNYGTAAFATSFELIEPISKISGNNNFEPGETANIRLISTYKDAQVFYLIRQGEKSIKEEWKILSNSVGQIDIPITEEMRGNIAVECIMIHSQRYYHKQVIINVPWSNKKLDLRLSTFRSKMYPGSEETWTATIKGPQGEKVAAEMLASMYDASLDEFSFKDWSIDIWPTRYHPKLFYPTLFALNQSSEFKNTYPIYNYYTQSYDELNWFGVGFYEGHGRRYRNLKSSSWEDTYHDMAEAAGNAAETKAIVVGKDNKNKERQDDNISKYSDDKTLARASNLNGPPVRKNFNETAFFYPHVYTNETGEYVFSFTMPDALTTWKFRAMAHTAQLQIGFHNEKVITQKELMVQPNLPRFLREGDEITISSKITNMSDADLQGQVRMVWLDAASMQPIEAYNSVLQTKPFVVNKGRSTEVNWSIRILDISQLVVCRIIAESGNFSDGEENVLTVLSDKMLVIESMPLPVNGLETKTFKFAKLINQNNQSNTLRNYRLTLEYTSNPAWYAVQALPYMMEYPYECAEQTFNRYYANSLSKHIADSDPRIRQVFETWKKLASQGKSNELLSNLEKNEELKALLLQESPYLLDGKNETERKQRIALLFDENMLNNSLQNAAKKLLDSQMPDGGWAWFYGMPGDRYITQYIMSGFGHLQNLKVKSYGFDENRIEKAIHFLDQELLKEYKDLKKYKVDQTKNNLSNSAIQYLYMRSFFNHIKYARGAEVEVNYYKEQAKKYWTGRDLMTKGMIALALHRHKDTITSKIILKSISEYALHNEEMGMFWKENSGGYYWYNAPIETQSILIEAYDEILSDTNSVDKMKTWLLKQKQVQDWKTTKATADACYVLLLRGTQLLADNKPVEIRLGNLDINPENIPGLEAEAGTGYIKTFWSKSEIKPEMGTISVSNPNKVTSWGALHWQYFEQMDKITPHETPLKLSKKIYIEKNTTKGPLLIEVGNTNFIQIGDKVIVRIELRVDRSMEYVHLKDMRAAGLEPINVLSQYKWQGGLGYFESTKDAATNFFITYLPKGTYVFEYPLRANNKGVFNNGIANIQCMYAPEYNSHSEGLRVTIK